MKERLRQLEQNGKSTRPSALPIGLSASRANSFVQTVLGIHHEPRESTHPPERARPVRLSAVQSEQKLRGDALDDSATDHEPRRASKRQKTTKTTPAHAPSEANPDATLQAGGKAAPRIRLKFIAATPKGQESQESNDVANEGGPQDAKIGTKRPRSPESSAQNPQKGKKKTPTAARNKIQIPHIPRAPDRTPMLPLQVGMFTLQSLGQITSPLDKASAKSLYPVGYQCER